MNNLFTICAVVFLILGVVELVLYKKGYGYKLFLIRDAFKPFGGFVSPKRANDIERSYLLLKAIVLIIVGVIIKLIYSK